MAKCHAYIVYHDGEYVIRPAFAVVQQNEKFKICNMTDFADAEVTLPKTRVDPSDQHKKTTDLQAGTQTLEFKLKNPGGCFNYQVTVDGYVAVGESDPVIIIDP